MSSGYVTRNHFSSFDAISRFDLSLASDSGCTSLQHSASFLPSKWWRM